MDGNGQGIRILIAGGHSIFREALRSLLEQEPDLQVVGEAADGREALDQLARLKPDVLLLDMAMPHLSGMETLHHIASVSPSVRPILLVDFPQQAEIIEALRLGVRGVIPKRTSAQLLLKSIRAVAAGEYWIGHQNISDLIDYLKATAGNERETAESNRFQLTARETDIIAVIVDGYTNKDIAIKLSISEQTVKHHLTSIFQKVGVPNRLELALLAMNQQLVL